MRLPFAAMMRFGQRGRQRLRMQERSWHRKRRMRKRSLQMRKRSLQMRKRSLQMGKRNLQTRRLSSERGSYLG